MFAGLLVCAVPVFPALTSPPRCACRLQANKLSGRGGLAPATNSRQDEPGASAATTPEAALTEALSAGPTNRRPEQERAESARDALRQALYDVNEQDTSRRSNYRNSEGKNVRKRPWNEGSHFMSAVAPRMWDTDLQSLNDQHGRNAEQRRRTDFVSNLDKLIAHLNTTILAAPKKRGNGGRGLFGGYTGRPDLQTQQGMTTTEKKERKKLMEQLVVQRSDLESMPLPEALKLISSLQVALR